MIADLDTLVARWLGTHRSAGLDSLCRALGQPMVVALLLLALGLGVFALCFARRRTALLLGVLIAGAGAWAAALALQELIQRPGPRGALWGADPSSMPTTAAAVGTAALLVLILVADGPWRWAAVALIVLADAVLLALLVYAQAGWATDVIAGAAVGGVVGALIVIPAERILRAALRRREGIDSLATDPLA